jgi:hypothetical protein
MSCFADIEENHDEFQSQWRVSCFLRTEVTHLQLLAIHEMCQHPHRHGYPATELEAAFPPQLLRLRCSAISFAHAHQRYFGHDKTSHHLHESKSFLLTLTLIKLQRKLLMEVRY